MPGLALHYTLDGLVAVRRGELVGLAHYRSFPEPLLGKDVGFLDDLFVPPAHRGQGIGRKLIDAVAAIARQRGWPVLRWSTPGHSAATGCRRPAAGLDRKSVV